MTLVFLSPQLRSYSRHDLFDPFEDMSEVRFRRQRVEMERRVSLGPSDQLKHRNPESELLFVSSDESLPDGSRQAAGDAVCEESLLPTR